MRHHQGRVVRAGAPATAAALAVRAFALAVAVAVAVTVTVTLAPAPARAVTSSRSVPSVFGGNGHNVSFDGRLFLVRDSAGWQAQVLRPEAITYLADGMPDALGPVWSARTLLLGPPSINENALAICEPDPALAPYACDAAGAAAAGGPYDCYDVWLLDSDAVTPVAMGGFVMRRRHLLLWVSSPRTAAAEVYGYVLDPAPTPLDPPVMGIEPTVTADGKLLIYQGHPDNDGQIDYLMYATNATACAAGGWTAPQSLTRMIGDPYVSGTYRLAERTLRAADGTVFYEEDAIHGAYPWVMPNGDAVLFDAAPMPCRAPDDPPGCGPRRNATSVLGYPTNWGVAVVDGGVNPSTTDGVRLFFSSPGPSTFAELPVGPGTDVWPFFGSNTSNYVELSFDDGLDGQYAGFWHLNESVGWDGALDTGHTPDVSGYFNTGTLHGGLAFAAANDGVVGKALAFDGVDDWIEVPDAASLSPVNGVTLDFYARPDVEPDCDGNNNWRLVLGKGDIGTGSYTVVLEENRALQVRFGVAGAGEQSLATPALALGVWTHVSCEWDGMSGAAGCWLDDAPVAAATLATGTLAPVAGASLTIGAAGARAACPAGDGAFAGALDEVSVSRYARRLGAPGPPPLSDSGTPNAGDAATPGLDAAAPGGDGGPGGAGDGGGGGSGGGRGCGCVVVAGRASPPSTDGIAGGAGSGGAPLLLVIALIALAAARRRARTRPRA
ncbi:MAG TPA: LamG-like jellyroll fold domain-containing protein [Myxococcota bacterium]|jgi:hypothetical protein|nr:LamG-like jellyroll fold domain-containing protein [Myxococcota bacterium]